MVALVTGVQTCALPISFVPRCLPCFSFGGLATASPNSATNSDAFGIAIRNLMGGTARQGALPTSLNHDRRYIAFQRVGNLWFEPPVAATIHLEPALEPIRHRRDRKSPRQNSRN